VSLQATNCFDIVNDAIGGATLDAAFGAVRRFGHVVSALGWGTRARRFRFAPAPTPACSRCRRC